MDSAHTGVETTFSTFCDIAMHFSGIGHTISVNCTIAGIFRRWDTWDSRISSLTLSPHCNGYIQTSVYTHVHTGRYACIYLLTLMGPCVIPLTGLGEYSCLCSLLDHMRIFCLLLRVGSGKND